jgi:hypothetical protein
LFQQKNPRLPGQRGFFEIEFSYKNNPAVPLEPVKRWSTDQLPSTLVGTRMLFIVLLISQKRQ